MTEKRFHHLPNFLHFVNNSKFDPDQYHKKLYKIQQVLDHLKPKFSSVQMPERNIWVNESLLFWNEQLGWIQHTTKAKQVWNEKLQTLQKHYRLRVELHGLYW